MPPSGRAARAHPWWAASALATVAALAVVGFAPAGAAEGPSIGPAAPAPPPSPCAEDPESARATVVDVFGDLRNAYKGGLPGPAGEAMRRRKTDAVARRHVDVETFSMSVLRIAWAQGTPEQHTNWQAALGALMHRRYMERLRNPVGHKLTVSEARVTCDRASVNAVLEQVGTGRRAELSLRLVYRGGVWRAWDVMVDAVSLADTWRGRFARYYRQGGIAEVDRQLARMAERFGSKTSAP